MRRCCKPIIPIVEFELGDDVFVSPVHDNIYISLEPQTDIDLLKDKVICDYKRLISSLERGQDIGDLEILLEEISAINLDQDLGNNREFIVEYYLNQ